MNVKKLCESAYLASNDPATGPPLHGAGMIDRSSGSTHVWLVRGEFSDSVVSELHRQLIKAGRVRSATRRGTISCGMLTSLAMIGLGLIVVLCGIGAK